MRSSWLALVIAAARFRALGLFFWLTQCVKKKPEAKGTVLDEFEPCTDAHDGEAYRVYRASLPPARLSLAGQRTDDASNFAYEQWPQPRQPGGRERSPTTQTLPLHAV